MNIPFGRCAYEARVWSPRMDVVGDVFSYDTETTVHEDPEYVEDVVIAAVFQGKTVFFVRRQDMRMFWTTHARCKVYMHTAAFDIAVTEKVGGADFHSMIEAGRIVDVAILWRLCRLAVDGVVPQKFNLALMSGDLLGISLKKDDRVRCGFGQFLDGHKVSYDRIPGEYLAYSGQDAVATYLLGVKLEYEATRLHALHGGGARVIGTNGTDGISALRGVLSHDIQLLGDIALRHIERAGIGVDAVAVARADADLKAAIEAGKVALSHHGYVPGQKGNTAAYNRIVKEIEARRHVTIRRCPKTGDVSQASDDLHEIADEEFVRAFVAYKDLSKTMSTYLARLRNAGGRVHPRYGLMTVSGRTTCNSPNVQNLPREGNVRGCFVPAEGHAFVTCDYRTLELCTLAQITYWRYGFSRMRDLINEGTDLHVFIAAQILGKPAPDITSEERRKAKAVNFGLPGGMGIRGLVDYARDVYSVTLSPTEAESWRAQWMALFPEMTRYLADEGAPAKLTRCMDLSDYPADRILDEQVPAMILIRIAGGAKETSVGRLFSQQELDWAWAKIAESKAAAHPLLQAQIVARKGSREVQQALVPGQPAITPSGRVRADCSYCESRNTPFQGAAADGAKLALYDLVVAGYRVVAFIHDEVLVEVPETQDYRPVAEDISRTMVDAMKKICPDVAVSTEYAVMRRWSKDAESVYDGAGRLIPWESEAARSS